MLGQVNYGIENKKNVNIPIVRKLITAVTLFLTLHVVSIYNETD